MTIIVTKHAHYVIVDVTKNIVDSVMWKYYNCIRVWIAIFGQAKKNTKIIDGFTTLSINITTYVEMKKRTKMWLQSLKKIFHSTKNDFIGKHAVHVLPLLFVWTFQ